MDTEQIIGLFLTITIIAMYAYTIADITSSRCRKPNDKMFWFLTVLCIPGMGMFWYYLKGRHTQNRWYPDRETDFSMFNG